MRAMQRAMYEAPTNEAMHFVKVFFVLVKYVFFKFCFYIFSCFFKTCFYMKKKAVDLELETLFFMYFNMSSVAFLHAVKWDSDRLWLARSVRLSSEGNECGSLRLMYENLWAKESRGKKSCIYTHMYFMHISIHIYNTSLHL